MSFCVVSSSEFIVRSASKSKPYKKVLLFFDFFKGRKENCTLVLTIFSTREKTEGLFFLSLPFLVHVPVESVESDSLPGPSCINRPAGGPTDRPTKSNQAAASLAKRSEKDSKNCTMPHVHFLPYIRRPLTLRRFRFLQELLLPPSEVGRQTLLGTDKQKRQTSTTTDRLRLHCSQKQEGPTDY